MKMKLTKRRQKLEQHQAIDYRSNDCCYYNIECRKRRSKELRQREAKIQSHQQDSQ